MTQSKADFIKVTNKKIEMYEMFQTAIMHITSILPKYNGKKMNKRFLDAVNTLLTDNNVPIQFYFNKSYNGERTRRFEMVYMNREFTLDYNTCVNTLYPGTNPEYLDEDFRLNAENFINVLGVELNRCKDCIEDYKAGLDKVDMVTSFYKDLEDYISTHMDKLPQCLQDKKYKYLNCPIY